jgi:hypothetical protein
LASPTADAAYHLVRYTDVIEAAAFVAALSRFLSYPQGNKYLRPVTPAEVWSCLYLKANEIERVEVYLNATALAAVREAFGEPSIVEARRGDQVPTDCILLIGAGGVEAWGVEQAQWHILSEHG